MPEHTHGGTDAPECTSCGPAVEGITRAPQCVFCERIDKGGYVDWGRGVVMFEPLNPVTRGHMLFVPRLHTRDAAEEPWITGAVFEAAAAYGERAARDFNLITSAGAAATQTIRHLHVHYVPRLKGDGLLLPWTGGVS